MTPSKHVLRTLRPPSARATLLLFPFSHEGRTNTGYTVQLAPPTEPVVACGGGTVSKVRLGRPEWQYTHPDLSRYNVYEVTVEHGAGISTTVSGLESVTVAAGQSVARGAKLGNALTPQIFFRILSGQRAINPLLVSRHFRVYDAHYVPGQAQTLRFAPDVLARSLSDAALSVLDGLRYLVYPSRRYLVNVDFNGDATKQGPAVAGYSDTDFWNVYQPVDFVGTYGYFCGYSVVYNSTPLMHLVDYDGIRGALRIEKITEPPSTQSGSIAAFDPMLTTWIGGVTGLTLHETFFTLRGAPTGNFQLYLYGAGGSCVFMVFVDNTPLPTQTVTGEAGTVFTAGGNYAVFSLTLGRNSTITVKAYGYLSGLQLLEV